MKFSDFDIKLDTSTNSFTHNNNEIKVLKYLPVRDKLDLIEIAFQKAEEEDGTYNEIKLDIYFHLNLIYLYTDLEFSPEDKEDEMELFDKLESSGIINEVIMHMDQTEYNNLEEYLVDTKEILEKYKHTAAAVLRTFVQDLPKNAAAAKEIVDSFDREKYQNITDFATAANGGRNIFTNQPVEK